MDLNYWEATPLIFPIAILAQLFARQDKYQHAFDAIQIGLEAGEKCGDQSWSAEYHRLFGQMLLTNAPKELQMHQAELYFRQAIAISQKQNAKFWELRATTSLCKLLIQQNRMPEALSIQQSICKSVTKGFDTVDLKDAFSLASFLNQ